MLLKRLCGAFGVSGYEREIREIIKEEIKGIGDEVTVDDLGNLIVLKKGHGENKKRIMASAHMDEIGFQVIEIDDKGFLRVRALGGIPIVPTIMNRVKFRNGVEGVVNASVDVDGIKNNIKKLYIDIGVESKEDAEKYIKIGDIANYVGDYVELKGNNVMSKALDNRAGCYILIEALKRMENPYNDVYCVFSVQEEVGLRGATVAANRIKPEIGIALDVTNSNDYPNAPEGSNKLGGGTAIKISDGSVICDEYLVDEMINCCEDNEIKYQRDVIDGGGTDAGAINRSNYGVKATGISIAMRYVHGPNGFVNKDDLDASIELLSKYVNREFEFQY